MLFLNVVCVFVGDASGICFQIFSTYFGMCVLCVVFFTVVKNTHSLSCRKHVLGFQGDLHFTCDPYNKLLDIYIKTFKLWMNIS